MYNKQQASVLVLVLDESYQYRWKRNCNCNRWETQCEICFRFDSRSGAGIQSNRIVSIGTVAVVRSSFFRQQAIHHNRVHTYRPIKSTDHFHLFTAKQARQPA
jgi:hypothetical protein